MASLQNPKFWLISNPWKPDWISRSGLTTNAHSVASRVLEVACVHIYVHSTVVSKFKMYYILLDGLSNIIYA